MSSAELRRRVPVAWAAILAVMAALALTPLHEALAHSAGSVADCEICLSTSTGGDAITVPAIDHVQLDRRDVAEPIASQRAEGAPEAASSQPRATPILS